MPCYKHRLAKGIKYWYTGQHLGIKYHSRAEFLTKSECRQAEAAKLKQIEKEARNPRQKMTLLELCTKRLDFLQTKSKKYYKDNHRTFKRLISILGDVEIDRITRRMIHDYLLGEAERLKEAGRDNYEVNAQLRYIRALFNMAVELDLLEFNPTSKLKFYPINHKLKYIPPERDFDLVYQNALPHQQKLITFVRESGARMSESLRATGDDVDLSLNLLTLWTRKKRYSDLTPRRIPLPEPLRAFKNDGRLFPQWTQYPRFLEKLCKRLNIKQFGWHAYRHRLASILAAKNVPLIEIRARLGHESIEVTQKYLRLLGWTKF